MRDKRQGSALQFSSWPIVETPTGLFRLQGRHGTFRIEENRTSHLIACRGKIGSSLSKQLVLPRGATLCPSSAGMPKFDHRPGLGLGRQLKGTFDSFCWLLPSQDRHSLPRIGGPDVEGKGFSSETRQQ